MTLNGRNITLAEINKISGAHHKYFNEDRRWLHLTVYTVNIKGRSTRLLSHSSLCVLFITAIGQRWWWIVMTAVIESDMWLVCINYAIWLVLSSTCHFLTDNSLHSADKNQQEMNAVTEKPRDAVVKFDTYRNLQQHRAVLPAIARLVLHLLWYKSLPL